MVKSERPNLLTDKSVGTRNRLAKMGISFPPVADKVLHSSQ